MVGAPGAQQIQAALCGRTGGLETFTFILRLRSALAASDSESDPAEDRATADDAEVSRESQRPADVQPVNAVRRQEPPLESRRVIRLS